MPSLRILLLSSALLRGCMLLYGLYQDAYSPLKYTDIDYYVFTDASRFVALSHTPYERETYRYTPLLAWLLLPTTWSPQWLWFSFGKVVFAAGDVLAGWLLYRVLRNGGMEAGRAGRYASIWLLNPMVATISTRGSSEGLLGVLVLGVVWAVDRRKPLVAGTLLGLAVHLKIYPAVYAPAILWWLECRDKEEEEEEAEEMGWTEKVIGFVNRERVIFGVAALATFLGLNWWMYQIYGQPFILHTYLHHLTRVDHRHNFSPYNILLYLTSSPNGDSLIPYSSIPFLPQILLSGIVIPLAFAKWDLPATMFAQTFAFVTFNKVCTSQYFMWYIVLLPFYLPYSSLRRKPWLGAAALFAWTLSQAAWLHQGYELEFLGKSTFFPGLWGAALFFFSVNVWLLGIVVGDIKDRRVGRRDKIE